MPLSTLNIEQKEAAICEYGNNLVIASAGTGKTSTIVGRISHLINNGVKPSEILLLTFTNKAALEMVNRVAKIFSEDIAKEIKAGTFHSISFKLLKELEINITLKQPNELKTLFKSIYEKRVFTQREDGTNPYDGGYLYDLYSLYLNANNNEDFITWIKDKNPAHELYTLIYEDVIDEFNSLKKEFGYVNFDDLLTTMLEVLKDNYFEFKEILVDEYQDTNPLQGRLLDSFKSKSLFCVGDYDQSIYAFNGSDIKIISSFSEKYENAKVFTLKKNYRSTKPILDLATKVIEHNDRIYPKKLDVVRQENIYQPKLLVFEELFLQYEYISSLISKTSTPYSDIAIIYRNNSSADGIEANLRELGIPAKRKGGMSFFDSVEVKYILDVLTLQVNSSDMMAFIHILEYGKGIGKAVAKDIFDALMKLGEKDAVKGLLEPLKSINNPFETKKSSYQLGLFDDFIELGSIAKFKDCSFDEAFFANPILKHPKLSVDGAKYIYDFYLLLKQLKRVKNPTNMIVNIGTSLVYSKLKEHLSIKRATQKDGTVNEILKFKSVAKLNQKVEILRNLSRNYNELYRFLNAMILGGSELSEGDGVNLLSIHASKGLEFKEVYIIDLMDGRFPNRKLMSKGGSIEEERRLFYVAVTRAKDILYLSYAKYDRIKKMSFVPSLFLKEAGLVEKKTDSEDI
ncbi:ATP-dependent helicase [Aliarcobacter thereius]|uniref:DNA 3'-5' helicase n=2 Tax=Aliarcobacter thereius TaxID=544718 RepID=A0A1C0B7V9_9BACT|nr:ATP-dependent helicase [Aliarcobacter thereius]OCL95417.1 ATP-dependent DNA helicase PcrA [Aliarcobacter thereius LMG 24486]OCL99689.1 ATP-dependent DNA helicase PcrA [Aliarcobacter thereius]QBF16595.1 ATP-dependent DNA helicase [Aliarcobacter thereius LMG 24486]TLS73059.1 ATP-dependent helicase [Aliarcobacter thereius]TLS93681.1 ATP-dependent helicase [Aliarcobacter thereius]